MKTFDDYLKLANYIASQFANSKIAEVSNEWSRGSVADWLGYKNPGTPEGIKAFRERVHAAAWHCANVVLHHYAKTLKVDGRMENRETAANSRQWIAKNGMNAVLKAYLLSFDRKSKEKVSIDILDAD